MCLLWGSDRNCDELPGMIGYVREMYRFWRADVCLLGINEKQMKSGSEKMADITRGTVLCGASSYSRKFYFNPEFASLPKGIQEDLKIMCVMYSSEVSGEIELVFTPDGDLLIRADHREDDALFDEIGSGLKIREMQRKRRELLESLENYYKVTRLGQAVPEEA